VDHQIQFAAAGVGGTNELYAFWISDTAQAAGANQPQVQYGIKVVYRDA